MAKLPKSLIKKYGISKKAWSIFRSQKSSSSTKLRKNKQMAKRRRTSRVKSSRRKSSGMSVFGVNLAKVGAAGTYGAMRQRVSLWLRDRGIIDKIPGGAIADEIGMFGGAWLLKKFVFKKAGFARDVLTFGQAIEAARIGEAVVNGEVNLGAFSMGGSASNGVGSQSFLPTLG